MRYTIEGFSQEYAMQFKKEIERKDKKVTIKIDCTDLVILRWFVDFYPKMKKMVIDGKEFAWLTHKKLLEDLPLIDISKDGFISRMQKLVEFEILDYKFIKENGSFSLYTFGKNYEGMVSNTQWVPVQSGTGVPVQPSIGVGGQSGTKDNNISNSSIIDKNNNKEENAPRSCNNSFDEIINNFTEHEPLRTALIEYVKMRKLIKKPLTSHALELCLTKKNTGLFDLSGGNDELATEIVNQSICNSWQGLFPLKKVDARKADKQESIIERYARL